MDNQMKKVVTAYQAYIAARVAYDIKKYRQITIAHYTVMLKELGG